MKFLLAFLLLLTTHYLLLIPLGTGTLVPTPVAFAQTVGLDQYCQAIANLPVPPDLPNPEYVEPDWEEIREVLVGKPPPYNYTKVEDTSILTDTADSNGRFGGVLSINELGLPFAKPLNDYLEGRFQDEDHRLADMSKFTPAQLKAYNGPIVVLQPQANQDDLRMEYVHYILGVIERSEAILGPNKVFLKEATFDFADVCGKNPRTIKELAATFGTKEPPSIHANIATDEEWDVWRKTWARWWPKIPIVDNRETQSCILFYSREGRIANSPPGTNTNPSNRGPRDCSILDQPNPAIRGVRLATSETERLDNLSHYAKLLLIPFQIIPKTLRDSVWSLIEWGKPQGPTSTTTVPIRILDSQVNLTGQANPNEEVTETLVNQSRFPNFGRRGWLSLLSHIVDENDSGKVLFTGAFRKFDPVFEFDKEQYKDSAQIQAQTSFVDTTSPGGGSLEPVKIWAGFLGGIHQAKEVVIKSLNPLLKK